MPAIPAGDVEVISGAIFVHQGGSWVGGGANPLEGALVADDFRVLGAWPAEWTARSGADDIRLTQCTFSAEGVLIPLVAADAPASRATVVFRRALPDGTPPLGLTHIYHIKTAAAYPGIADLNNMYFQSGYIHDPTSADDAEVFTRLLRSVATGTIAVLDSFGCYLGPPDFAFSNQSAIQVFADTWIPVSVEYLIVNWYTATHFNYAIRGHDTADRSVAWTGDPTTFAPTTLNVTTFISPAPANEASHIGEDRCTLKGVYVLDHPPAAGELDLIEAYLIG